MCFASERNVRRITRALKHTVLQQQTIDVDKALQILDEEPPPLVVDRDKLKVWDTVKIDDLNCLNNFFFFCRGAYVNIYMFIS